MTSADPHDPLDDLRLLRIEIQTLYGWSRDGRIRLPHHLVIAVGSDGTSGFTPGPDLPGLLAGDIRHRLFSAGWEAAVELARDRLAEVGERPVVSSGPSYLVPPDVRHEPSIEVVRSDRDAGSDLRTANPGNWPDEEWTHLLVSDQPWAMVVRDGIAVALAHVPVSSPAAAEVGVWTHPDHRGRGYAGAVTAALGSIVTSTGRRLLYSTSADNTASQRVAAKLGLRPIGQLVRVSPPDVADLHLGLVG